MEELLIIDDGYIKANYPLAYNVDTNRLASVIRKTQRIQLRSLLGDALYQAVVDYCQNEDDTNPISAVIEDIRQLHCLYVEKALFTTYYKDLGDDVRESNISYIEGDIKTLESWVVDNVVNNTQVYNIASDDSSANAFDEDYLNYSTIYYPTSS